MIPPPGTMPPPNGHSQTSSVQTDQPIRDRWGRRYRLRGDISRARIRFALFTKQEIEVGQVEIAISGNDGLLQTLCVTDGSTVQIPRFAKPILARILPPRISGHRNRGLGSLLLIFGLRAACDLRLKQVIVPKITNTAASLFRTLGFALEPTDGGFTAAYRISS